VAGGRRAHLRTTGYCGFQPAHTDAWKPLLHHKDLPSASLIIALQENTGVTVYSGSHRVFRQREH